MMSQVRGRLIIGKAVLIIRWSDNEHALVALVLVICVHHWCMHNIVRWDDSAVWSFGSAAAVRFVHLIPCYSYLILDWIGTSCCCCCIWCSTEFVCFPINLLATASCCWIVLSRAASPSHRYPAGHSFFTLLVTYCAIIRNLLQLLSLPRDIITMEVTGISFNLHLQHKRTL